MNPVHPFVAALVASGPHAHVLAVQVRVAVLENEGKLSFITENGQRPPQTEDRISE